MKYRANKILLSDVRQEGLKFAKKEIITKNSISPCRIER